MARVIVNVPATAKRGEVIEIRTLAGHDMETGFRRTQTGELVPRDIITQLVCSYNGVEVFRADLHPAIAANPLSSSFFDSGHCIGFCTDRGRRAVAAALACPALT